MTTTSRARKAAFPLAAAAATLMTFSQAMAAPPQVVVNGAGSDLQLGNPVQISGVATDSDGIKQIYGTIKVAKSGKFVTGKGKFSDQPSRLQFNFKPSKSTRWQAQSFNLPTGRYVFNIRVEDQNGELSEIQNVPFYATGKARNAAQANNQQTQGNSAAPRIAIQFPKRGQVLKQASAFSGIARDDQAVTGVTVSYRHLTLPTIYSV